MPTLCLRSARRFFVSMLVIAAACGDDKGGTDGSTSNATPATEGTGDTPTEASGSSGMTSEPTGDPTADPTSAPGGMYCQDECSADADCVAMGMNFGFKCVDKRCAAEASGGGCSDDLDCQVQLSGWAMSCAAQTDCAGQVCIDIGGEGRCAVAPSDAVMCEVFNQKEIMFPRFPEGDQVPVCSNTDYTCEDGGVCENPCESDADCTQITGYPVCNVGTGLCECGSDDDCALLDRPAASVCQNGFCGCGTDADCAGTNTDVCNEGGLCGCSSATVCTQAGFDGTTPVCAGF